MFSIKDTGIGISKEQQKKIFDAFSQADASTSRRFGGTGLGLSISSKFVSLMGGELKVESKEGEGARFFFELKLEISKDAQRFDRDKLKIGNIVVGYLLKDSNEIAYVNLIRYLDVLEIDYKKLYCKNLDKTVDGIDILFIDNEYIDNISIFKTVTDLNIKTVLLTRAKFDSCKCPVRDNFSRVYINL